MRELELRGAMDVLNRAQAHTYGADPCIRDMDHLDAVGILRTAWLEVRRELQTCS